MPTRPWFPTFIYDAPLLPRPDADFVRALMDDCRKIRAHDKAGRAGAARTTRPATRRTGR